MSKSRIETYDPYDFRFSRVGSFLYQVYFKHNNSLVLGIICILQILTPFWRLFGIIKRRSYPILDAFELRRAFLTRRIDSTAMDRLIAKGVQSKNGISFGLGVKLPINDKITYDSNATFTTITIYVYILLAENEQLIKVFPKYWNVLDHIEKYFIHDIDFTEYGDNVFASYSRNKDRIVLNSSAYVLRVYSDIKKRQSKNYNANKNLIDDRIERLFLSISQTQKENGAWPYAIDSPSFTDCLHSAFIIESLIYSDVTRELSSKLINRNLSYLKKNHFDHNIKLYYRYPTNQKGFKGILNKFQISLYDNVEMYNVLKLLNMDQEAKELKKAILEKFGEDYVFRNNILIPFKHGRNLERWGLCQKRFYFEYHNN